MRNLKLCQRILVALGIENLLENSKRLGTHAVSLKINQSNYLSVLYLEYTDSNNTKSQHPCLIRF